MNNVNNMPGAHMDCHPGVTYEGVTLEERTNCDGSKYWYAKQAIGSLFGYEVEGECSGIGRTKEQALERLAEDKRKLQESMWA